VKALEEKAAADIADAIVSVEIVPEIEHIADTIRAAAAAATPIAPAMLTGIKCPSLIMKK